MSIRLADFIFKYLADHGVDTIFLLTGGGAMHLNDAVLQEGRIRHICHHHEQACAMAAEGYTRVSGKIGVVNVTTGPGGINAMTGVFGAWTDSIPMLIISGQVKRETCMSTYHISGLRQLGEQEANVIDMVSGITKYSHQITDPQSVRYHLEKALFLAQSGRPGPCWLDIPVDVQAAIIEEESLVAYEPNEDQVLFDLSLIDNQCLEVIKQIKESKRPVILAGTGVRLSQANDVFTRIIHKLRIPVTTASTHDIIASDDEVFCGRPGPVGDRGGNFTVQNSDLLIILGSRLSIRQIGYNWKSFARNAFKIQVDIDPTEFEKPTVKPDLTIHCDINVFLHQLEKQLPMSDYDYRLHEDWLEWCKLRVKRYPIIQPEMKSFKGKINPYDFLDQLFLKLNHDDVVVTGCGAACKMTFQIATIKCGQRMFSNSGAASMGYDLPAAIGAAVARGGKRVICIAGDGSIQQNIQELATIVANKLPIKILVLNNGGYLSIRTTQKNYFGRFIGEGENSGLIFPDYEKVAKAYGLPSVRIEGKEFNQAIDYVLNLDGAILAEVIVDPDQMIEPKLTSRLLPDGTMSSPSLEDLYPFLSRDELLNNIISSECQKE